MHAASKGLEDLNILQKTRTIDRDGKLWRYFFSQPCALALTQSIGSQRQSPTKKTHDTGRADLKVALGQFPGECMHHALAADSPSHGNSMRKLHFPRL
jgi:hypothetical protein